MEQTTINIPAMYGDHHVLEVRRILLELPAVEAVNASSCFHAVEVTYDPDKVSAGEIKARLGKAGYLDELPTPAETGVAATQEAKQNGSTFFRHTTAFEQTKHVVSFAQTVAHSERPLWPCPGVGTINRAELEEVNHG
ncbi:MAG: heavy-metal-associated domain-containing protein [Anaerolineae bacterium]